MITSNLKLFMDQQNLSIQQLADKAKVSGHTIFRVRSTALIRCTSLGTLEKIAEALGCSPKQLFEYEPNRYYEHFPKLR